jgi:hypothetical protein
MTLRDGAMLGVLAAALLGASAWQNQVVTRRMGTLTDRVETTDSLSIRPPTVQRPADRELTAAEAKRLAVASRQADEIIQSGRLTSADVGRLSEQLEGLPWRQALDVRRRIAHAINMQQLVPTELPFPLP